MSDKRAVITITSSIAAIAFVIGIMTVSAASTDITTQATTLGTVGHVTITIADSDGNIKAYIQADNVNSDITSDCIAVDLFAPTLPGPGFGVFVDPACGIFTNMGIGFDITPELDDNTVLNVETVSARTVCAPVAAKAVGVAGPSAAQVTCAAPAHTITAGDIAAAVAAETANINVAATLVVNRVATPGNAVDCADLIPAGGDGTSDSCEISEIAMFDLAAGGNMYGRITIATLAQGAPPGNVAQYVKVGDTVTATYNTNIG